jgi:hypothetical protein
MSPRRRASAHFPDRRAPIDRQSDRAARQLFDTREEPGTARSCRIQRRDDHECETAE